MTELTRELVVEKIKETDRLFDGHSSPGGAWIPGDKEYAYIRMRLMVRELMDEFLGDSE